MATLDQIRQQFPSARGLSDNEIIDRLSQRSGLPYERVAAQFGITKDTSSGFFGGAQDVAIEAANAAAGLVGSVGEFVAPGNRFSAGIRENIIEPGEARQTVPTQLAKRALSRGLESSEFGPQASAVYQYVTENPLLAAGQALGSFAGVGLPVRGATLVARGVGLGQQAAARAGLGTGAVVSGAAGGGDAAGAAYELVMQTPREVLLSHPQAQELINAGVTDEAAIYEELATRAARRASVAPAALGALAGATGAERLIAAPVRGARRAAMQVGIETGTEALEEGATAYSGRAAAQQYNPAVDPMAGVAGSALMGGIMGAGIATPIAIATMDRTPAPGEATDLTGKAPAAISGAADGELVGPARELVGPQAGSAAQGEIRDPYSVIADRAATGRPMPQREQEQLLSSFFAAQQAGEDYQDLLAGRQRGLEAAQRVGEQYQRTVGQRGDQLLQAQDVGLAARPLVAGLQQTADTEAAQIAAAQQAGAGAQMLPGMTAGAGTAADFRRIMDPRVMQPVEPAPQAPAPRTSLLPTQAPFSNIRMDRPGEAPAVQGPTSRLEDRPVVSPPSGAPAVSPAAPDAAGGSLEQPMAPQEQRQLQRLIDAADNTEIGRALPAAVRGAEAVKAPGKATITDQALRKIRDALVYGREATGVDEGTQRVVGSLNYFAESYEKYLRAGDKVTQKRKLVKKDAVAETDKAIEDLNLAAQTARQALAELGEAVGGNAKNVEAVVRLVKDMVQGKIIAPGRTKADTIKAAAKLDTVLSQAWAAAKREVFLPENVDLADVRGSAVRQSREVAATGEMSQIEKAATEGIYVNKETGTLRGVAAVMHYLRRFGTPMERQLAVALREAFVAQENPVQVQFIDSGTPRFDPATNTIYIRRDESPEVLLHEAFHGALQSYVYRNPGDAAVIYLKRALKDVVNFKGTLTGKAKEVQDLLKKLVAEKKELDAVLELVSYGTTLNDFRRAMQAMPSRGVPASFTASVNKLWAAIKRAASRMLGDKPSLASDVLQASIDLLDQARKKAPQAGLGNVLEAAVQSSKPLSDAKAAAALGVPEQDYSRWAKSNLINMLPTQRLFEAVGWSEANAKKFVGDAGTKLKDFVSKTFPGAEIALGLINSRYAVNTSVSQVMDRFKLDKGIGYQYAEDLANVISRRPAAEVNALFAYLDGDKKALDALPDSAKLKANADKLKEWFDLYVADLSDVEQRYFKSRKFSETLLFPERTEQVAGGTFGLGKINEVLGLKRKSETELDENWFTKDENGDLLLDGDMFQVFKIDNTVKPGVPEGAGFMSAARFAELGGKNPIGYSVDTTRKWVHEGASDQGHSFITNTTARDKIADQKADDVANALRNTVAALANNYASKHFIKSVSEMGSDGNPHAQVAFDSLDALNKEFGTSITEDKVLPVSYEMSRSPQTKALYRQSGTWVKLPDSKVYGELSGKYLPGPVWNAMVDMSDRQPLVNLRAVNNTMRWFKKSKTVWNPGTHVTNAASNVTMAMLHDISFSTLRDATKLLAKYETAPNALTKAELAMVLAFRDSGAMLADYSSAEVKEALYKAHAENLRGGEDVSVARRVAGMLGIEKSKAEWLKQQAAKVGKGANYMDDLASQLYAAEDNVFRLAAFLKTAGTLQARAGVAAPTPEMLSEAGLFARKAFGDYDIDSKAVKVARQTVMPFISWFYAMAPVLGRIAVYQPWKFANVLAAYMLLEGAMGAAGAGDDDELRKQGPESIRERMFFGTIGPYMHVRIPFMGDDQNPVYYKLGDYFPMASMTKGLPNGFMGQSWFPGGLTPSGPFVSAIAGMVLGVDPYTGKSIHQPTDTDWDKLWNVTKFGYDIAIPPAVSSRQIGRVDDLLAGKTGVTGVEPSPLVLARMFGLKMYDYNVDEQAAINEIVVKRIERDFKSAMTKATRDEMRKGYPDFEALDAELNKLRERMDKEIEKARGGAED